MYEALRQQILYKKKNPLKSLVFLLFNLDALMFLLTLFKVIAIIHQILRTVVGSNQVVDFVGILHVLPVLACVSSHKRHADML